MKSRSKLMMAVIALAASGLIAAPVALADPGGNEGTPLTSQRGSVELEGIEADEVDLGEGIEIKLEDGVTTIKLTDALVATSGGGFVATATDGTTFMLAGGLTADLGSVVGRTAEVRGTLVGDTIIVERLKTDDDLARIELRDDREAEFEIEDELVELDNSGPGSIDED